MSAGYYDGGGGTWGGHLLRSTATEWVVWMLGDRMGCMDAYFGKGGDVFPA